MKKKIAALCAALCVMSLAAGCGKKEDVLDKNDPVTITARSWTALTNLWKNSTARSARKRE